MTIFTNLYRTILDALFPLSPVEQALLSLSPEEALRALPPAPDYSGLIVDLPYAHSVFAYKDDRVSRLIWNIKYKKSTHAVNIGGYALFSELEDIISALPQEILLVLVVPIPITTSRRRERGYNQCELLIDEIDRLQQQLGTSTLVFEKDLLLRIGNTSEQKLKNRKERAEGAHDIFSVNTEKVSLYNKNMHIIVLDDVITTGSTLHEALETLKKAGFVNIQALSLAH
ncbi:MAG: hypothetical protein RLY66_603 [Candidatus Parcubacteria bacterium]|jgi:ComF family protein